VKDPKAKQWLTRADGLATRLRQARGDRSGLSVAKALGWQSSKVTRIEQGIQVPSADDIRAWGSEVGQDQAQIDQLLAMLEEFRSIRGVFRQRAKGGAAPVQAEYTGLVAESTLIRWFNLSAVPGIVQLPEYARAVFEENYRMNRGEGVQDIDAAVEARMRRQPLLYDRTRSFEIVMDESVLYRKRASIEVMRAQLDRLLPLGSLPNVRFGIVPRDGFVAIPLMHAFGIYDDRTFIEVYTGEEPANTDDPDFFPYVMEQLWSSAVEGEEARRLIVKAIDALSET
jgi:hypothetical protein